MNAEAVTRQRGEFGRIVDRLMPDRVPLSRLVRLVGASNPHFYGVMAGERDNKPVRPSPELAQKFIDALRELGATVPDTDAEAMMSIAAKLPEGYQVIRGNLAEIERIPNDDDSPAVDFLRGLPPDKQERADKMLRAAFAEEDAKDNAGNIGKRAE